MDTSKHVKLSRVTCTSSLNKGNYAFIEKQNVTYAIFLWVEEGTGPDFRFICL